ncbi:nitrous oxide reductase accessory protein NosL [Halorubrum sp. DTA98]|uniref:nitrous oxide reductase accessory protein NosL n=1 Tax=Halorubrum sp. DTA98 TaxID=3402163 RepID=UPI003AB07E1D
MFDSIRVSLGRRRLLTSVGASLSVSIAGCLGGRDETATPITLDGERTCDQCGMIIEDHPGPVGQIHFADDEPEGGRPAGFCSSTCTYTYRFDASDVGRDVRTVFLTDYSIVDQDVFEEGSDVLFSSHVEAEAFTRTTELTVVATSEVAGSMGPDLIPFSDDADVESFVDDYGGEPMAAESVDRATIDAL